MKPCLSEEKHQHTASLARGKVLDIGFATKPNTYLRGAYGVDIQKAPRPKNYAAVFVCNLNTDPLPFPDSSFDTVIMDDTIEHVENPTAVLLEIYRVLKRRGLLLIATPNACYWWMVVDDWFFFQRKDLDDGAHLSNWTRRDFIRLLRKNGFTTEAMYGQGTMIPLIHWQFFNKNSPRLGWTVLYQARKTHVPDRLVLTTKSYGAPYIRLAQRERKPPRSGKQPRRAATPTPVSGNQQA